MSKTAKSSARKSKKAPARKAFPRRSSPAQRKPPADTRREISPADAEWFYQQLLKLYPDARCALNHENAYQLLVATILSAQCTDERVNMITPTFFARWPDATALAKASQKEIEEVIHSTGFYRNKAKALLGAAKMLVERFGGQVPQTMEELLQLPGVARKTANVVLGNVFGKNEGVVVDTHVVRLAQRLGLSRHSDPAKIEQDLMRLFPRHTWTRLAHVLIFHGRRVCTARKPDCAHCTLAERCPRIGV